MVSKLERVQASVGGQDLSNSSFEIGCSALKTLNSLNKDPWPFLLGNTSTWSFPSVSSLSITAFGGPESYSSLAITAFGAFELIVPNRGV